MTEKEDNPIMRYARNMKVRTTKSDIKRALIIEAAIDCLGTEGLAQFTFKNLTKRSGLSRSHINYYFKKQEDLIAAAIEAVVAYGQDYTVKALKSTRSKHQLATYISITFNWLSEHPTHYSVMMMLNYMCTFSKNQHELSAGIRAFSVERIADLICVHLGLKKVTPKVHRTAGDVRNILVGSLVEHLSSGAYGTTEQAINNTNKIVADLVASRFA